MAFHPQPAALARLIRQWLIPLLLCLAPHSIAQTGSAIPPLARLAQSLAGAPAPLRADLAQAALIELSDAYAREADQARADQSRETQERDLRRWAAAIDNLAREYALLAETITPYTPVGLRVGPDRVVYMNVAGKPVAVSGPRPREQDALERRILARYCQVNLCDSDAFAAIADPTAPPIAPGSEPMMRIVPRPPVAATYWSFSPAGPVCATDDGLEFQFDSTDDLGHKRAACAAVVTELQRLADALKNQQDLGARIDWEAIKVRAVTDNALHQVTYNHTGGDFFLSLDTLAGVPELVTFARPWLAARSRGDRYHLVIPHADRHMARIAVR